MVFPHSGPFHSVSLIFCLLIIIVIIASVLTTTSQAATLTLHQADQCAPGQFKNVTSGTCERCEAGTWSWGGTFNSCEPCPPNTYTPYRSVVSETLCLPCPPGYSSPPGSTRCTPTTTTNTNTKKSTSSIMFPPVTRCGKFFIPPPEGVSYFPSSRCVSPITGCPPGLQLFKWARKAVCQSRKSGVVRCGRLNVFDGVDRCVRCAAGEKLVRTPDEQRKVRCERCGGNSAGLGGLRTKCIQCKCGFVRSADGSKCINTVPQGKTVTC